MRLTDEEQAMLAGQFGPATQWAIDHQIKVGRYLGPENFVPVSQPPRMAYQPALPAVRGEHVGSGDTGVVIYSNSVCGARSNFEGGPSALSAGLTGRTPRYGYHLDAKRRATLLIDVAWTPRELNDWGALGGIVGRMAGDYWQVPLLPSTQ